MTQHNVDFVQDGDKWKANCSAFDLNESYDTRNEAFTAAHLHIALALAGEESHD